jgi:hypothetical protein
MAGRECKVNLAKLVAESPKNTQVEVKDGGLGMGVVSSASFELFKHLNYM